MKKTVLTIVITAVVAVAVTLLGLYAYNSYQKNKYDKLIQEPGIKEIKEIDFTLPKFTIVLKGMYYTTVSNSDIKDLKTYEIQAVMNDGIYSDLYTYQGVKLKDVFELYEIEDYNNVIMKSNGKLQVTYSKEEISDNMYLVFSVDGKLLPENEPVNLLNTDLNSRYSISNVVRMDFE